MDVAILKSMMAKTNRYMYIRNGSMVPNPDKHFLKPALQAKVFKY